MMGSILVVGFVMILSAAIFINSTGLRVLVVVTGFLFTNIGIIALLVGESKSEFLGKPLKVQDLAVGKDFIVSQVLGGGYTIVEVKKKTGDWGIVKGLPTMAPETIFIIAERNGKKIVVIPIPEAKK
ncbi:hypothetical protein KJ586_03955 [Patescibacteria group bacterium]|nr:hypothetical protein [Patescibacteria group bacterium]MBU4455636.1 hypothetical protein [Patescibacteria group bacterium]